MTDALAIEFRPMAESDRNYILSSWLRSLAESAEWRHVPRAVFFHLYEPLVKGILEDAGVIIATLPEARDVIIGWMCSSNEALHYVLVKPRWRRLGVATRMLEGTEGLQVVYTHEPPGFVSVPDGWTYEPMRRFGKEAA